MADETNTKTMVIVAIIGAIGAIGAALIPIILADRSPPPAIVIAPPPAVAAPADSGAMTKAAPASKEPPSEGASQASVEAKQAYAKAKSANVAEKQAFAKTKKAAAPATDEERILGRWRIVTQEARAKGAISEERDDNPVWRFHGDKLEILRSVDGKMTPWLEGTYKIHRGPRGRGFFDATLTGVQGQGRKMEWVGIYDFEGDLLKVCYKVRRLPDDPVPDRPGAFAVDSEGGNFSFNVRFRHVGPRVP